MKLETLKWINLVSVAAILFQLYSCGGGPMGDPKTIIPNSVQDPREEEVIQHKYELVGNKDRYFDPKDYGEFPHMSELESGAYEFNSMSYQLKKVRRWIGHSTCEDCSVGLPKSQLFQINHPITDYFYRIYVVPSYRVGTSRYRARILSGGAAIISGSQKDFVQEGWFDSADDWMIEIQALDETEIVLEITNDETSGNNYIYLDYYEFVPRSPTQASTIGFGRSTVGGGLGASICWVENLNDSGAGSLRECARRNGPKEIRFKVDGAINLSSFIDLNAHTTLDGVGRNIRITGSRDSHLLRVAGDRGSYNVIIRNLTFMRGEPQDQEQACDTCKIDIAINRGARQVIVERNTFRHCLNKCLGIQGAIQEVTVSHNRFLNSYHAILIGHSDSTEQEEQQLARFDDRIQVTLHHNLFSGISRRQPRANRSRYVHLFNNLHDGWGNLSAKDYAVGSTSGAQVLIENDVFIAPSEIKVASLFEWPERTGISTGLIKARGCLLRNAALVAENSEGFTFNPRDFYPYELSATDDRLVSDLRTKTGANAS